MAAGQRKRKLNGVSVARLCFHEHNVGTKKMKLESSDIILNMTSHVSLEWDDGQKEVVAKKEQIGITWRDMAPFLDHTQRFQRGLADVFSVPQEILGLENIADVLSYEVWETSLSEQERKLLTQFLPSGVDVDNVVQSLLAGENFHFGNPFCKWGASLCAGNLHPDAVLHMERWLGATRNSYLCELRKYHSGITENLSKLKERWTTCKNPEKEISEKIWRERVTKSMNGSPLVAPEATGAPSSSEKEQPHNPCFRYGDTAKYMSYIKVNKMQHQLVKNINHFGDGIQPKCLNRVLGDIKVFNVQPYEAFEEEERKRLHERWLQLANKDLPAALENRTEFRLLRDKWRKFVQHELVEKVMIKDEKEDLRCSPMEKADDRDLEQESPIDMQGGGYVQPDFKDRHHLETNPLVNAHQELSPTFSDSKQNLDLLKPTTTHSSHSTYNFHLEKIPSLNSPQEHNPSALDQGANEYLVESATTSPALSKFNGHEDAEGPTESKASSPSDHLERIFSLNSQKEQSPVDVHEDENRDSRKCANNSPVVSQFLQSISTAHDAVEQKLSVTSPEGIWQGDLTGPSYHHYSSQSQVCISADELALQQPQSMEEQSAQLIDLESQMLDRAAAVSIASSFHVNDRVAMFGSNLNQSHNLLFPPFHEHGISPSHLQEHLNGSRQSGLQFLVTNDGLRQSSQFSHPFYEQQQLPMQSQAREKDLYMQPILSRNMHSSSRYPGQGHFLSVGSQDWSNFQTSVNGRLMGHNLFMREHGTHSGWSGTETSGSVGQCIGDAGSADGSLFSVLSERNMLPSHSPFVAVSSEGFLPGGNFVSSSSRHSDGAYMYAPLLNNASTRDSAGLKINGVPWMNLSLQNHGL